MKICPHCQTEYDDTKKFCRHDGSPLETKALEGEAAAAGSLLTCSQCGKPVEIGKKFCRSCGARLATDPQPLVARTTSAFLAEEQNRFEPSAENLAIAQKHYVQGKYKEAIAQVEQLLVQEPNNRLYQLYWLLSNVKAYGIHGYENGIAEALRWQGLTKEEQPLARELFILAGKEHLTNGDPADAEQYLLRAYHLSPSREVASVLAVVEDRKGEQAQKEGDLRQALLNYQKAAEYDPGNQTYARKIARVVSLHTEENWRKRQAVQRKIAKGVTLGLAATLLIVSGIFGYRKAREWYQTPSPQNELAIADQNEPVLLPETESTSTPSGTGDSPEATREPEGNAGVSSFVAGSPEGQSQGSGDDKSQVSGQEPGPIATATEPPKEEPGRGKVVTARELGIRVSGKGAGDSNRSSEAIQQEVETYLASLQEVYEIERTSDPSLMGSLVLDLKIAPDGRTSNARLQSAKIASKKLQDIVHGLVHEWRFSPASGEVQVSYPLLFLPPGMDATSIIAWERSTAALKTSQQPVGVTPDGTPERPPAPSSDPKKQVPLGMYRVITSTPLRSEPRTDGSVVNQLRSGIKVRVVGVEGDYLEVRSSKGRPSGYVHQKDVLFVSSR